MITERDGNIHDVYHAINLTLDDNTWQELAKLKEEFGIAKKSFVRIAVRKAIDDFNVANGKI